MYRNHGHKVVLPGAPQSLIPNSLAELGTGLGIKFSTRFGAINILCQYTINHACATSPIRIHPSH